MRSTSASGMAMCCFLLTDKAAPSSSTPKESLKMLIPFGWTSGWYGRPLGENVAWYQKTGFRTYAVTDADHKLFYLTSSANAIPWLPGT